jgi:hypothetical protein
MMRQPLPSGSKFWEKGWLAPTLRHKMTLPGSRNRSSPDGRMPAEPRAMRDRRRSKRLQWGIAREVCKASFSTRYSLATC